VLASLDLQEVLLLQPGHLRYHMLPCCLSMPSHTVDFSAVEIQQVTLGGGYGIALLVAKLVCQCNLKEICTLQK